MRWSKRHALALMCTLFATVLVSSVVSDQPNAANSASGATVDKTEKGHIDEWLNTNAKTLNKFGDSIDAQYTGGSPLFDEKTGSTTDLYEYILSKNPSKPWAATPEPKVPEATKEGTKTEDEARRTAAKDEAPSSETPSEDTEEDSGMGMTLIIGAGAAAVVAAVGFFAMNGDGETRRKKGSAVLILGPSNAGKTSLYLTLKDGKVCTGTTTSMQENEGTFKIAQDGEDEPEVHFIDYPGDRSLSYRIPDFYPVAKVVVFMVDSNDKKSIEREAAEIMYSMLTHPGIVDQSPSIIVACNKTDLILHSKPALLKKLFETELQKLTVTQGLAEDSVTADDDVKETIPLGITGENFEFDKHSPCGVEFVKCSVKNGELKDLISRIRDCMEA